MSLLVSRGGRVLTWGEDWQVKRERKAHLSESPALLLQQPGTVPSVPLKYGTVSIILFVIYPLWLKSLAVEFAWFPSRASPFFHPAR